MAPTVNKTISVSKWDKWGKKNFHETFYSEQCHHFWLADRRQENNNINNHYTKTETIYLSQNDLSVNLKYQIHTHYTEVEFSFQPISPSWVVFVISPATREKLKSLQYENIAFSKYDGTETNSSTRVPVSMIDISSPTKALALCYVARDNKTILLNVQSKYFVSGYFMKHNFSSMLQTAVPTNVGALIKRVYLNKEKLSPPERLSYLFAIQVPKISVIVISMSPNFKVNESQNHLKFLWVKTFASISVSQWTQLGYFRDIYQQAKNRNGFTWKNAWNSCQSIDSSLPKIFSREDQQHLFHQLRSADIIDSAIYIDLYITKSRQR